jgi:hypothetical protein
MSDGLRTYNDAVETYEELCKKFNEKPEYMASRMGKVINPYGRHADELKKKNGLTNNK